MKFLISTINSFRLGIDINNILEVVIPGINSSESPEKILHEKSMVYQDNKITIINTAEMLFNIPPEISNNYRIILCEVKGEIIGLMVDNADEIVRLPGENRLSTEKYTSDLKPDFVEGKYIEDEKEIYIIALQRIVSAVKAL